ncbi:MAG TPA: hypothetical protein VKA32_10680, partial [Gammaproteobacteria bacterium]|nr:hypothetical protein [Gammaproteobacteria bacterium]
GSDGGTPGQKDLFDGDYALNAAVVELGTVDEFQRVSGTVDSAVTSDSFDLQADQAVADGSGGTLANPVPVQLYPQTHIYSRDGTAREQTYIAPNQSAMVDSVASGGALNASLVVLGTPPRTGIPGTLATIAPGNDSFTMDVSTDYSGGGPAAGNSVTVAVDSATRIVLIDGSDNSLVRLNDLSGLTGASVTVYGDYESSTNTVVADTVVVITS